MPRSLPMFLLVSLVAGTALATTVLDVPLDRMAKDSPVIVEGIVTGQTTRWTSERRIETLTTVEVTRAHKGTESSEIVVWQSGGTIGDVTHAIPGDASFSKGEQVLLFLEPAPAAKGAFVLVGMASAKFRIVKQDDRVIVVRELGGLSFARPGPDGVIRPAPTPAAGALSLDALRRTIADALP